MPFDEKKKVELLLNTFQHLTPAQLYKRMDTWSRIRTARGVGEDARKRDYGLDTEGHLNFMAKRLGLDPDVIEVVWNPRMRSTAGRAWYDYAVIWLNTRLLTGTEEGYGHAVQTLGHEIAHLIGHGHGLKWKRAMNTLGLPAERTHKLDVSELQYKQSRRKRYRYLCPCGTRVGLGPTQYKRAISGKGQRYLCRRCGQFLLKDPRHYEEY